MDEVKAKLRMRQEGAIKRDRAMAYSLSTQVIKLRTYFVVYDLFLRQGLFVKIIAKFMWFSQDCVLVQTQKPLRH